MKIVSIDTCTCRARVYDTRTHGLVADNQFNRVLDPLEVEAYRNDPDAFREVTPAAGSLPLEDQIEPVQPEAA